jgi:hypothetical protein
MIHRHLLKIAVEVRKEGTYLYKVFEGHQGHNHKINLYSELDQNYEGDNRE